MPDPLLLVAVLAAGASRRLGRPKQLVPLAGDESLLHRQCRIAVEANVGPVVVILGCHAHACAAVTSDLPVTVRVNNGWMEGLASSIRTAARAATHADADGLLLLHSDQFRVSADDLRLIRSAWIDAGATRACRAHATDAGYAGPPVILPRESFEAAMELRGDEGARRVLGPNVIEVPMPNAAWDLDEPAHLADLLD